METQMRLVRDTSKECQGAIQGYGLAQQQCVLAMEDIGMGEGTLLQINVSMRKAGKRDKKVRIK